MWLWIFFLLIIIGFFFFGIPPVEGFSSYYPYTYNTCFQDIFGQMRCEDPWYYPYSTEFPFSYYYPSYNPWYFRNPRIRERMLKKGIYQRGMKEVEEEANKPRIYTPSGPCLGNSCMMRG